MNLEAIRYGIAANLRTIPDAQISPYFLENPTGPTIAVVGFEGIDYVQTFGDDASFSAIVEGAVPWNAGGDVGAQKLFDRWLAPTGEFSVRAAVNSNHRLTDRLSPTGELEEDVEPAADDCACMSFRGYRRQRLSTGVEVLLGDWLVQVETSS